VLRGEQFESEDTGGEREANGGPRSVTRLLALFDALSHAREGVSLAELSTMLESPKSSLLNLLRPLVAEAYLIHSGGRYRLGPSVFRLASGVLDAWQLPKRVHPCMEELAARTGESVLLSVMDSDKGTMTYVDIVHSPQPVRYQIALGTVRPLYASAAGRVLLAYAEEAWRQRYLADVQFDTPLVAPMSRVALGRELEQIRQEGLTWSIDGFMVGLSSVAAPVFDAAGTCIASLNIAGPSERFRSELEARKAALRECAADASRAISAA